MSEATATKEQTIDDKISKARNDVIIAARAVLTFAGSTLSVVSASFVILVQLSLILGVFFLLAAVVCAALLYFYVGMFIRANLSHRELLAEKYSKN